MKGLYFTERIIEAMKEAIKYPLTIIEAPMGYGKTTAVMEQLSLLNVNTMWQRVYDNSLGSFWNGFCHVLSIIDGANAQSLLALEFPSDSVTLRAALNIMERIEFPENSMIVIDDYHITECEEINNFIEFVVMSESLDVKFMITTRYTYFPRLEEMKLKGYLYLIENEAFELSKEDIISYYRQCGVKLKAIEAEELYSFTEGWISGLYLLMLSRKTRGSYIYTNDIYTLIDKVFFSLLPDKSKELLIGISIFDNFTLEQAEYMLEENDLKPLISGLIERNAFITYDFNEKTYHLHSILKRFLKEKFDIRQKTYMEAVYRRAARWFIKQREYFVSMRHAYIAADFDIIMEAIELDTGKSSSGEYKEAITRYFTTCPMECKRKFPLSMLIVARWLFMLNEVKLFQQACEEFVMNIRYIEDSDSKNRLMGEFQLLMSFTGYNDIKKMSQYHRRACELLKSPSTILGKNNNWTFGAPSVLYMFYRKSGELKKDVQVIREAMPFYYQVTDGHGKGAEYMMAAEHYYYIGDFKNSEITMHKAMVEANEEFQSGIVICAVFLQIKLALIKGNFDDILMLFKKLRESVNREKRYFFMHTLDMCETFIYSSLNTKEHIEPWIRNGEFKNTKLYFPAVASLNIVYGRVLLINGEYLKLLDLSGQFIGVASVFPNLLGQIYTYIYMAAANKQIFRQKEALAALTHALDLSMPDKVFMPFVENCDFIMPLLEELSRKGVRREDITNILDLYKTYGSSVGKIIREHFNGDKPSLTEREMEVAKLAAAGLSNKEIGESLFISQNTVKTQLKSVFEKLCVNSRALLKQYVNDKN